MPLTSRDLLTSTLAASLGGAALATFPTRAGATRAAAVPGGRERLLVDPNWRFACGHASDPARDFGFGSGNDWAVELPFENAEELKDHGRKPIDRNYPATSIGWYRRVYWNPGSNEGRRLSLEFDGVYREAMVALSR